MLPVLVPKTSPQMPKESPLSKVPKTLEVPLDDPVTDEELKLDVKEKTPSTKIAIEKISIGKRSTPRDRKTVTSSKKIVTIPKKRKPAFELKNKLLADWSESDTEKGELLSLLFF